MRVAGTADSVRAQQPEPGHGGEPPGDPVGIRPGRLGQQADQVADVRLGRTAPGRGRGPRRRRLVRRAGVGRGGGVVRAARVLGGARGLRLPCCQGGVTRCRARERAGPPGLARCTRRGRRGGLRVLGPRLFQCREAAGHVGRGGAGAVQPPGDGRRVGPGIQRGAGVRQGRASIACGAVRPRDAAQIVEQGAQQQGAAGAGPYALCRPAGSGAGECRPDQPGRRRVTERGEGVGAHEGGRQGLGEADGLRIDVVLAAFGDGEQDR